MPTKQEFPDTELAGPDAGALVESLRGLGYSLETALADLIDNSITAEAGRIWISFWWDGEASAILVEDDGNGMDEAGLKQAMRLGSQGPGVDRDARDLGRFGLGLKTASMSQCRRFTVRSSTPDSKRIATRCWDLDLIKSSREWLLTTKASERSEALIAQLGKSRHHGTIVLWEGLDRLVGAAQASDTGARDRFLEHVDKVRAHLGTVFHRFLEGRNPLEIRVNDQPVVPWDPFLREEPATQALGQEILPFDGRTITIQPYVLPHNSKINKEVHERAAGIRGWNASQGFYVYRAERLLVAGDWLGLPFQKEEHAKLARIKIDLPNSLDSEWHLDVRKARARPPGALRPDLKRIAKATREKATSVYRHRGKILDRAISAANYMWHYKSKAGKTFFEINREHPLIVQLLEEPEPARSRTKRLLRLLEETVPLPTIAMLSSQSPDSAPVPFAAASESEVETLARNIYEALRLGGMTPVQAAERLRVLEPFPLYNSLLERIMPELLDHE